MWWVQSSSWAVLALPCAGLGFYFFYLLPIVWIGLVEPLLALNGVWHTRDCPRWVFLEQPVLGVLCCCCPGTGSPPGLVRGFWCRQDTGGDSGGRAQTGELLLWPGLALTLEELSGKGTALLSQCESHTISLADTVPPQRGSRSNNSSEGIFSLLSKGD